MVNLLRSWPHFIVGTALLALFYFIPAPRSRISMAAQ
jgi:hypothetical protein